MIAQAFANKKRVALGRVVLTTREHPVMLEPFGGGLLMTTLRAADEVRAAEFDFDMVIDRLVKEEFLFELDAIVAVPE